MKVFISTLSALTISLCAFDACARDDVQEYSIADALSSVQAKEILGTDIQFYFGDQPHAAIAKEFGEYSTSKKTNGVNKSDKEACEWVFLSAMKTFRDRAKNLGANAVVNIRSNYKNNLTSSTTTFTCGSGALMSGAALKGTAVTLK